MRFWPRRLSTQLLSTYTSRTETQCFRLPVTHGETRIEGLLNATNPQRINAQIIATAMSRSMRRHRTKITKVIFQPGISKGQHQARLRDLNKRNRSKGSGHAVTPVKTRYINNGKAVCYRLGMSALYPVTCVVMAALLARLAMAGGCMFTGCVSSAVSWLALGW